MGEPCAGDIPEYLHETETTRVHGYGILSAATKAQVHKLCAVCGEILTPLWVTRLPMAPGKSVPMLARLLEFFGTLTEAERERWCTRYIVNAEQTVHDLAVAQNDYVTAQNDRNTMSMLTAIREGKR